MDGELNPAIMVGGLVRSGQVFSNCHSVTISFENNLGKRLLPWPTVPLPPLRNLFPREHDLLLMNRLTVMDATCMTKCQNSVTSVLLVDCLHHHLSVPIKESTWYRIQECSSQDLRPSIQQPTKTRMLPASGEFESLSFPYCHQDEIPAVTDTQIEVLWETLRQSTQLSPAQTPDTQKLR